MSPSTAPFAVAFAFALGVLAGVRAQDPVADRLRVNGFVVDPLGQPVFGGEVWIDDALAPKRTATDATGCFVLATPRRQNVLVHARVPGRCAGAAWIDGSVPVATTRIELLPARPLRGKITGPGGNPVASAFVCARSLGEGEWERRLAAIVCTGTTDADGEYELGEVVLGPLAVVVVAAGLCSVRREIDGTAERFDVSLAAADARTLDLTIAGVDAPALRKARFWIRAEDESTTMPLPPWLATPRPDDGGAVHLVGAPKHLRLIVEPDAAGLAFAPRFDFVPMGPPQWECRFATTATPELLRGRVTDGNGAAVAGLHVVAVPIRPLSCTGRLPTAATDADGTFALPAPADAGESVAVRCLETDRIVLPDPQEEGSVMLGWRTVEHDPAVAHEFAIGPAFVVTGTVLDRKGRPPVGAQVVLAHQDGVTVTGEVAADGSFRLGAIGVRAASTATLTVADRRGWYATTLQIAGNAPIAVGQITLRPAGAITGTVLADGRPVAGRRLMLLSTQLAWRLAISGTDGTFCFSGLPDDRYWISSGEAVTDEILVLDGETQQVEIKVQ